MHPPQKPPTRLGVGPSTRGRDETPEDRERPPGDARRRDGSVDPVTGVSAAHDNGGAAAPSHREEPSEGSCHRVPGARKHECQDVERSGVTMWRMAVEWCGSDNGAADVGSSASPTQRRRPERDGSRGREEDGNQTDETGDTARSRDGPGSQRIVNHFMSFGVPGPRCSASGKGGGSEGTEATSSQEVTEAGDEEAAATGERPPVSQARRCQRRGPLRPTGPQGDRFCDSNLSRRKGHLDCSRLMMSPNPPSSLTLPPALAAHPHLRRARPRAGGAPSGEPGVPLTEVQWRSAAAGSSCSHDVDAVREQGAGAGGVTVGGTSKEAAVVTIADADGGSADEPRVEEGPKRRRLRGKQAVGGCSAANQAVDSGGVSNNIHGRQSGRREEDHHPHLQSEVDEATLVAPDTSSSPAASRMTRISSGELAASGHSACSLGDHSQVNSESRGPSRLTVGTSTRQCFRALPRNRDGHELTACGASDDMSAWFWRGRPPEREG